MTDKKEKIEDERVDAQIKKQARKVIIKGNLLALGMMILVMMIP
jgi:hypothetical protein